MHVVAFLPPPLLTHVRVVLGGEHSVVAVESWEALHQALRRSPVDVVLVDPSAAGGSETEAVVALRLAHPNLPVVVYTVLSPVVLRSITTLARHGVEHVVLFRFDDEPQRFRDLLERLPGYVLGDQVLEALAEPLGRLPAAVARAIERCFRLPHRFHDAGDLAGAAGVTLRQLYRVLEGAGLESPRLVTQSARLLRAYAYLQDPGATLAATAAKLGYSAPRVLSGQIVEATGLRPSELRDTMAPQQFVQLIVRRLYPACVGEEGTV